MPAPEPSPGRRTALLVAATIALAGCGTQSGGAGSSPGTSSAGGDDFDQRARLVTEKVRASGLIDRYAAGVVLLQGRVSWGGFEDDRAKEGAAAGSGLLAVPSVPFPKTARVEVPGGAPVELPLISAGKAAAEAIWAPCGPTERCTLSLDSARLTETAVLTNHGRLKLPAWEFTGGGLSEPLHVVAADPAALATIEPTDLDLPGVTGLASGQSLGAVDGTSLGVELGLGSCDTDLTARVHEEKDVVVVGGTVKPPAPGQSCDAMLSLRQVTLTLAAPLGTRPVVDVVSGRLLTR